MTPSSFPCFQPREDALRPVLGSIHECATALSRAALRAYFTDQNPRCRERYKAECQRLLTELADLHTALQAGEVSP